MKKSTKVINISYDHKQADGLFFAWLGIKGSNGVPGKQNQSTISEYSSVKDLSLNQTLNSGENLFWYVL